MSESSSKPGANSVLTKPVSKERLQSELIKYEFLASPTPAAETTSVT